MKCKLQQKYCISLDDEIVSVSIRFNVHIQEGRKEMFYLTTHSTHFIYGYMASDIW